MSDQTIEIDRHGKVHHPTNCDCGLPGCPDVQEAAPGVTVAMLNQAVSTAIEVTLRMATDEVRAGIPPTAWTIDYAAIQRFVARELNKKRE